MWHISVDRVLAVEWRVSKRCDDSDRMMHTIFAGPGAKERAEQYAAWMNQQEQGTEADERPIDPGEAARRCC